MEEKELKKKPVQIQIHVEDKVAEGVYSNLFVINHNENEFVLDFIYVPPQPVKAKVLARIITSPKLIKRFHQALTENIKMYEKNFGEISPSKINEEHFLH